VASNSPNSPLLLPSRHAQQHYHRRRVVYRMNASGVYAAGCTLRFPRIVAVRDPGDKGWDGASTLAELSAAVAQSREEKERERGSKEKKPSVRKVAKACLTDWVAAWCLVLYAQPAARPLVIALQQPQNAMQSNDAPRC
jgi:hypothetical protein